MARAHGASPSTIQTHTARLGRHALLFLWHHRPRGPLGETLVVDGFESFEHSQYYPFHLNLAAGGHSHFLYAFTEAELRRKGRMSARQKARRQQLEARHGRPTPQALERSMAELLELVVPPGSAVEVHSDDHPAYPRAWRRLSGIQLRHCTTPSTRARRCAPPPRYRYAH